MDDLLKETWSEWTDQGQEIQEQLLIEHDQVQQHFEEMKSKLSKQHFVALRTLKSKRMGHAHPDVNLISDSDFEARKNLIESEMPKFMVDKAVTIAQWLRDMQINGTK